LSLTAIVLSGPVSSGKTTLARRLEDRYGAVHLRTRELMASHARACGQVLPMDRAALQKYGQELDDQTNGRWVVDGDGLGRAIAELGGDGLVVIDAIRTSAQLDALREALGRAVVHVHLKAPRPILDARYQARRGTSPVTELSSYAEVAEDPTEASIGRLEADADHAINTHRSTADDVEVRCAAYVGLLPRLGEPLVDVVVGGQFGSEGKGNVAFYLASEYDVLVRVGGPNAGHIVPLDPPYTHRLLPSGTRANEEAHLVIGPGAVINTDVLLSEIADSQVEVGRLSIDPQVMVIEEDDWIAEQRLREEIGSTGQGVGRATARRIMGRGELPDGYSKVRLAGSIPTLAPYTRHRTAEVLSDAFSQGKRVLLEGTQGADLSLYHGTYPWVTSRETTGAGCLAEAGIAPRRVRQVVMVVRTYPIRVGGDSGPMSQEISWEEIAERSELDLSDILQTEKGSVSRNQRRVSEFDWVQLRRAAEINGATDIALTFADYLDAQNDKARRFDQLTERTIQFIDEIQQVAGAPVTLVSTRFHERSIIDRRSWRRSRR
jgi:adenylosuccinate synthase